MSLLLYAIAADDFTAGEPAGQGVDGLPLRLVSEAGLTALVSDRPPELDASERRVLAYQATVQQLMGTAPILPARFATALESEAAVEQLLRDRCDELHDRLRSVRGAVELGLRACIMRPSRGGSPAAQTGV